MPKVIIVGAGGRDFHNFNLGGWAATLDEILQPLIGRARPTAADVVKAERQALERAFCVAPTRNWAWL
jgi:hypothetical protein